jgi:hypothetical protein
MYLEVVSQSAAQKKKLFHFLFFLGRAFAIQSNDLYGPSRLGWMSEIRFVWMARPAAHHHWLDGEVGLHVGLLLRVHM